MDAIDSRNPANLEKMIAKKILKKKYVVQGHNKKH